MQNLADIKRNIKTNYSMISILCEEELKSCFNIVDVCTGPIQTGIKSTLEIIEGIRINSFIRGITEGKMSEEDFISYYKKYGDKKKLVELIEQQRRTHTEIINLICGCIIRNNYKENTAISATQINRIDFLISLTANDFYNCLVMYNECKEKQSSYKVSNSSNLSVVLTTKSKLEQYGYAITNSFSGGDIVLNKDFFNLIEQSILRYFAYEELLNILAY